MAPPEFRKFKLSNGVTLVVERHSHVRSVSIGVWVAVGSSRETALQNGLSHFIEHMVFKGTERRTPLQIATALESLGGDLNAFTDKETTCFHATVLSEFLEEALDVLSDLLLRPTFPKNEFERERGVLIQELSMVRDSPEEWIGDLFFETVWPTHPLGRPVIGTKKNLQRLSRQSVLNYFREHYVPQNIVISVAGNVDLDSVRELCEKYFQFPDEKPIPTKVVAAPKFASRRRALSANTEQLHLLFGVEGVSVVHPARFDVLLLSYFLGGGMSSRLFQEIREKAGLAYSVDCDAVSYSSGGALLIGAAMAPRSFSKCVDILRRELNRLKNEPISEADLAVVKGQLRGMILLSSDQMETRQESIGRNELVFRRYVPVDEVLSEVQKVSSESILKTVNELFVPEKETIVVLAKNKPKLSGVSVLV